MNIVKEISHHVHAKNKNCTTTIHEKAQNLPENIYNYR